MSQLFSGWGGTAPSAAVPARPTDADAVCELLRHAAQAGRPLVARGLGRAYGDAAQCAGGIVVETGALSGILDADLELGWVRAGSGTSLDTLMRTLLPAGWFVPVSPGTRQVSVGGAVAADIHGKNHHRDGSFCQHVTAVTLATPTGTRDLSPDADGEDGALFWATAGGMGMTGVITETSLSLVPVETSSMVVDTSRAADLDELMAGLVECDGRRRYSVAWIDCQSSGRHLGRGVITAGDHARLDDLAEGRRRDALDFAPGRPLEVPVQAPSGLLNPLTVAAFNELWFRKAPRRREGEIQPLATFFHPLDGVGGWNKLYGRRGFLQYQLVVPDDRADTVRQVVERLGKGRVASFLAVLKRFGEGDRAPLSFPMAGWTLSLDLPVGPAQLDGLLDQLDELVAEAGGRVYLAKDSRLRPELLETMYPRLSEWRAVRDRVDPDRVLCSDLARRLALLGPAPAPQPTRRRPRRRATVAASTASTGGLP